MPSLKKVFTHRLVFFVCSEEMPEDVGVNAVVPSLWAKRAGLSIIDVARYPSTPYEIRSRVAILPVNKKAPLTKTIHLVSGSYKNGSQGVLSVFPGQVTPPFPKKDETNLVLKDFWTDHLFLADAEQVYLALKEELTHKHPESFEGKSRKFIPDSKIKPKTFLFVATLKDVSLLCWGRVVIWQN